MNQQIIQNTISQMRCSERDKDTLREQLDAGNRDAFFATQFLIIHQPQQQRHSHMEESK